MKNIFYKYKIKAIKECKTLTYAEKTKGLWKKRAIHEYFDCLKLDDANKKISSLLLRKKLNGKKILIIGGGTGKLGRNLSNKCNYVKIVEIDSSLSISNHANYLAKKEKLKNFISINASCQKIPFKDNFFDYVVAYGVFRYIPENDHKISISEIIRVCENSFIISEPAMGNFLLSLKKQIPNSINIKLNKQKITMFRMSLFYMLFKLYKNDKNFKKVVDSKINLKNNFIKIISNIAGTKKGYLYNLVCKK
ncbi:MAG TPA: class I SAM-dependent methyltransferase [Candidatus Paceibacterota bacterium]|nr:class I SAM-dependent methyltransferase [Candidatus Paceibacterota bacterium]HPT18246.1 class I SAM-dependent methyltransferase [Candidatus Paceibacterota bacterium]